MESLLQLRKRLSRWDGDAGEESNAHLVKKIKIVSSDGVLKYDFVERPSVRAPPPTETSVATKVENGGFSPEVKPAQNPFVVRVEAPRTSNDQPSSLSEAKVIYLKADPQGAYDLPLNESYRMRAYSVRQRRCHNASLDDDEIRAAYAKLKLTPPTHSYEEMNESERGIYRFVRRRLMNKNSARQSRLRRKELFKEYENTIQIQAEKLERSENRLRILLACLINAVTLIALQSIPQILSPSNNDSALASMGEANTTECLGCQRSELFNSAVLDVIHTFGSDVYDDAEGGINQLLADLRVCGTDHPIKQLLQRQERSLSSIFNANGIKDVLDAAGIPQWKLSLMTANALRSAWSVFLGPQDQPFLFDSPSQPAKEEHDGSGYFENFVNELFDPVKHAELIQAINNGCDLAQPPDSRP